jgi:hypothetical protein
MKHFRFQGGNMTKLKSCSLSQITIPFFLVALVFSLLAIASRAFADEIPLEAAKIIIEFNSTAEDVGVQAFLDGEPWKTMEITSPDGRKIYSVKGKGNVKKLGSTELFFESEEPALADLPLPDFLELFPEGTYEFRGKSAEGKDELVGSATFTHNIPDGPVIVSPQGGVVNPNNVVIDWNAVTTPSGIQIVQYQVIVEGGNPQREFSIFLPAALTSVAVPSEFFEPGTSYKFEILAIEVGGNQTITEGTFSTSL